MAGACIGFLSHNRYKASVFMGDVGSLALGGALAAIASCTGMFLPLLISAGIFVLEAVSVIMQVLCIHAFFSLIIILLVMKNLRCLVNSYVQFQSVSCISFICASAFPWYSCHLSFFIFGNTFM